MFFTIINDMDIELEEAKTMLRNEALARIYQYKDSTNEIALNKYLLKNCKISLRTLCQKLALNCLIEKSENEIIIKFPEKLDVLASLITYGTGKIQGSHILQYMFLNY